MSDDKKAVGRRGAGRGRRQAAPQEPLPPGPLPDEGLTLATYPGSGDGAQRQAESPIESDEGSPKGSPSGEDIDEKMKNLQVSNIIRPMGRPGFGAVGNKLRVLANHFEIRLDKQLNVVQYHADITHERMKLSKDDKRIIFWAAVAKNMNIFKSAHRLAYDGDHICICLDRLQFSGKGEAGQAQGKFTVRVRLPRMEREEDFTVSLVAANMIHVNLANTNASGADRYTSPLQVLDLIFRQRRSFPLDEATKNIWYSYASTVYRIPEDGGGSALSCGRVIWQGLFGAARVGQALTPFINFDVSHSGFYRPQQVVDFMIEILNSCNPNPRAPPQFHRSQLKADTQLREDWVKALNRALKGLKVTMTTRKADGTTYEHEYTVNQVVPENAVTHKFMQRQSDGNERQVSVADYFKERYGPLKYPGLNLLHVGPKRTRKCYLPMEHCMISLNQRIKKLTPVETASMIRAAAIDAPSRRGKINDLVRDSRFGEDPWLQEFGIRVNQNMKEVEARVLIPPKIRFSPAGGNRSVVDPREGVWDMRGQKFFRGASCNRIGALILDDKRDAPLYGGFFSFLLSTCRELGMSVPGSVPENAVFFINASDLTKIEQALTELKRMGAEFVIVTLPQKSPTLYSEVKRAAEISVGIMTQCVVKANIQKCMNKNDRMTTGNIALKMNMKLGGINSLADANTLAQSVLTEEPTLVLGIDVTHPAQQEKKMPSISSVVGNMDDSFMQYGASIRVQKHRRESIVAGHLDQQVKDRLMDYHKSVMANNANRKEQKKSRPARIIIFRDGVAEGQFQEVLREELSGIRQACKDLDASYLPKLTLIVAQKRHHTRFFPTDKGPVSGRGQNIIPGTVIDKDITHPDQFEFYLCAHFGIQGTSRPIRYHVLHDDSNFAADHIQAMAYYLCHCYSRCTRAVSLPAPVYFADLACRRARAHIFDKVSDFGSDTMSQRSGSGGDTETAISEDELIRSSTVHDLLKMRMYFT